MFLSSIQNFDVSVLHWHEVLAAIAGLIVFGIGSFKTLKSIFLSISCANKSVTEFLDLIPELKKLTAEFKPNGGKSLKDIMNRMENSLAHTEQKIRLISSYLGMAYFEASSDGDYTFVSKKWMEITGFSFEQAVGSGWLSIVDKDMRREMKEEWLSCIDQKREFHFNTVLNNETCNSVSIVAWPIKNRDGSVEKFFGILLL